MSPLESRKRILIAESELNRAEVVEEIEGLKTRLHEFSHRAQSYGTILSSVALLGSTLTAFKRRRKADATDNNSWSQTFLTGAGLVSKMWRTLRPKGGDKTEE